MSRFPLLVVALAFGWMALGAGPPPKSNAAYIEDLDDDEFEVRQNASKTLVARDLSAANSMERARLGPLSLEQSDRIHKALKKIYRAPRKNAEIRATVALIGQIRTIYAATQTRDAATILDHVVTRISKASVKEILEHEKTSEAAHAKIAPLVKKLGGADDENLVKEIGKLAGEIANLEKNVEAVFNDAFRKTKLTYTSSVRERSFGPVRYRAGTYYRITFRERSFILVASARGFRIWQETEVNNDQPSPMHRLSVFDEDVFTDLKQRFDGDHFACLSRGLYLDAVMGQVGRDYYEVAFSGASSHSNRAEELAIKILKSIWKESQEASLPKVTDLPAELREEIRIPVGRSALIRP